MRWALIVLGITACGADDARPKPPIAAVGTLVVDPGTPDLMLPSAQLPDPVEADRAAQRDVVSTVTSAPFLHAIAADAAFARRLGADPDGALATAVSARAVKDSRVVEIAVALADRSLAIDVCNAILVEALRDRRVELLDGCRTRL
jgi:hypothetical protein